jgi:hypothetical protein
VLYLYHPAAQSLSADPPTTPTVLVLVVVEYFHGRKEVVFLMVDGFIFKKC